MKKSVAGVVTIVALLAAVLSLVSTGAGAADRPPWQGLEHTGDSLAPIGQGFDVTATDLAFILDQIQIAEQHAATRTDLDPCSTLIGPGPNQIPEGGNAHEFMLGLRTISGECNNLLPGQENFGAADEVFPRLAPADLRPPYTIPLGGGPVIDPTPREVSNLIVDQTDFNPAAVAAAGGAPVVFPTGAEQEILNEAPDEGLSAPFNSMLTFFGQFFDHGLDFVAKSGSDVVMMPLDPSDPLFVGGEPNVMMMNRTVTSASDAGVNKTTPFVDQNQTYASHPSKTVFLRAYEFNADPLPKPVATGKLIEAAAGGMATWGDLKAYAAQFLGIQLVDLDIHDVPLLVTDPYGNFVPGPLRGMPLISLNNGTSFLEGDANANAGAGVLVPATADRTGHDFLADIAHTANPQPGLIADADAIVTPGAISNPAYVPNPGGTLYDDEMLDAHFMAGDGRVNENIALTAVHHVFHAEHNRLIEDIQMTLIADPAVGPAELAQWQATGPSGWMFGDRLFQAAKLVTEMEYQHLVFEEFGRTIQPDINVFGGYDATINPAITAEFAHSTYRFGHSMLNADVTRFQANGTPDDVTLFDAFLNPPAFLDGTYANSDEAAGALFRGGVVQIGAEIDEFVVDALRNQLLGLPLDLAAINLARGRDTGIPRLNDARRAFGVTDTSITPYASWIEFQGALKNAGSDETIVNFIAAYGTHPDLIAAGSDLGVRRGIAYNLANGLHPDSADFMFGMNAWANVGDRSITGLEDIDLWIGGLAEAKAPFGGFLGASHNFVFETQMERLQDGDRFYYLGRLEGQNLLNALEGNSFSEMVMRNTDAEALPGVIFSRPTYNFDVAVIGANPGVVTDDPATGYDESNLSPDLGLNRLVDGTIWYPGGEHANWNGSNGDDRVRSGAGDDTIRGNDGVDRLEGGAGNDDIIGGEGDDILTDSQGVDDIKGGPGDDYIAGGPGLGDLLQGGAGADFFFGGNDGAEILGGLDGDFVLAGGGADEVLAGFGDDWIESGGDADGVTADQGNEIIDDPLGGNDVINTGPGEDRTFAEGGVDIFIHDTGTDDHEGGIGFDWYTHYGDPLPADTDLAIGELTPVPVDPLRDRFNLVEALSGWDHDDLLKGDGLTPLDIGGNDLEASDIPLIENLDQILPDGALGFAGGNIILGGAGSDTIHGFALDDIIDGDAYLMVQLRQGGMMYDSLTELQTAVSTGAIDPGTIDIIRRIELGSEGTDIDTAVFQGPRADYDVFVVGDGIIVDHARGDGLLVDSELNDGMDLLRNVELAQFADMTIPLGTHECAGLTVTVNIALGQVPTAGDDVISGTHLSDNIDGLGGNDVICGLAGDDTINGGAGNDYILGAAGMDTIDGGVLEDYIDGGADDDILRGGDANDQIHGREGGDTIEGGAGFDFLLGYGGADTIYGEGPGVLTGDADYLWGGAGVDTYHGNGGDDWLEGEDGGEGIGEVMNGDAGNDIILGHGGADTLNGGSGLDYLWGGGGIDAYNGGADRDTLDGNDGGENGGETMNGDGGDDIIVGHGGNDILNGGGDMDYLWGGAGVDTYNGGPGADYLDGNDGGEDAGETMNGDAGEDQVIGWGGNDILNGGDDDDYLWGGDGADNLFGDAGANDICVDPQNGVFDISCEATMMAFTPLNN